MKKDWKSLNPIACLLLAGSAAYALCVTGPELLTSGWESIIVLLVLGFLLAWHVLCAIPRHADLPYRLLPFGVVPPRPAASDSMAIVTKADAYIAWALLALLAVVALVPCDLSHEWRFAFALWLFLLAPACYLLGRHAAFLLAAPFAVFAVILPLQEALFLIISQPLRLIATMGSVELLSLCGVTVTYNLTTISLPDVQFGITDACSGIQQLEALLLLGYLLVRWQQTGFWWQLFHYAFIVPAVIIANIIRLMAVVLLYKTIGPRVLDTDWHAGLGYVQVLLTITCLWLFGCAVNLLHQTLAAPDAHHASQPSKGGAKK